MNWPSLISCAVFLLFSVSDPSIQIGIELQGSQGVLIVNLNDGLGAVVELEG